MFSEDAIRAGAICEQLEDVKYCAAHQMNPLNGGIEKEKWEQAMKTAEALAENDPTFTIHNMKSFQIAVNEHLKNQSGARLFDGLSEADHFAARRFYYFNNY